MAAGPEAPVAEEVARAVVEEVLGEVSAVVEVVGLEEVRGEVNGAVAADSAAALAEVNGAAVEVEVRSARKEGESGADRTAAPTNLVEEALVALVALVALRAAISSMASSACLPTKE